MQTQDFDLLIGKKFTLYKSNLLYHFQLDKVLYEVLEDESDGYRSAMKHVAIIDDDSDEYWNHENLGEVIIEKAPKRESDNDYYEYDGWIIKSTEDNHIWLKFGTNNADDYYPSFSFEWNTRGN